MKCCKYFVYLFTVIYLLCYWASSGPECWLEWIRPGQYLWSHWKKWKLSTFIYIVTKRFNWLLFGCTFRFPKEYSVTTYKVSSNNFVCLSLTDASHLPESVSFVVFQVSISYVNATPTPYKIVIAIRQPKNSRFDKKRSLSSSPSYYQPYYFAATNAISQQLRCFSFWICIYCFVISEHIGLLTQPKKRQYLYAFN